jgi:NADPH:quinone reductase-like Zn-dependent oxidoreductase
LLGDDNFTLKVSPDGSTFYDSLKMLADSGRMALKRNASGLSAAGTSQSDATAIAAQTNQFTTVGANQGARMPWPEQGDFIFVANAGANALRVYPHYGHYINALAADAFFSLPAGKNALFWAATGDRWYALLSA